MNDGLLPGIDYGSSLKSVRQQVKIGQGASVYRGEAIIWKTADDITVGGNRSQGGAMTIPKQDFVIQVPITKIAKLPQNSTAIMLTVPDGGIAGGNARGIGSIDLQYYRTANSQVASGDRSVVIGNRNTGVTDSVAIGGQNSTANQFCSAIGYQNTVGGSGAGASAIGQGNTSNGAASSALGVSNTASSQRATAIGANNSLNSTSGNSFAGGYLNTITAGSAIGIGDSNTVNSANSIVLGKDGSSQGIVGKNVIANAMITSIGDNQEGKYTLKRRTADATATVITTNNAAASTTNQVILSNQSSFGFTGIITARRKGSEATDETKVWKIEGAIRRGANAASTTLVGTPTITVLGADTNAAAWTIELTADTTNGALAITTTGEAAKNIQWTGTIYASESIYA